MMHAPGVRLRVVLVLVDRNFHLRFASAVAVAAAACAVDVAFHHLSLLAVESSKL